VQREQQCGFDGNEEVADCALGFSGQRIELEGRCSPVHRIGSSGFDPLQRPPLGHRSDVDPPVRLRGRGRRYGAVGVDAAVPPQEVGDGFVEVHPLGRFGAAPVDLT